ncbi:uncharacterized protein LOC112345062 isoform X1 [Selaginella moellendorffii]|uniref:uncharacterized protein LOC112345062 isoform X1 n=1 Tax=Selaginella moellendorffii TaxID=88036 RepID=UPI000D1CA506|nr:uncharacterized protein LOC112345062 isoform X1 [Selaginella moellendorffii]XP_024526723.1 uncharacterized protein LOC112345062 isoform X1 [Selaginella moellendorffii]|eukprot:XP_024526722.1 uncharacterized protein LOC112345062 isoform X1 [Selaginella moellendorffii]
MEEAEPEPPSEEEVAEEKKIDEDNAWIVKTLEDHDTREDLEQRVIQHIMQDPIIFRSLRNTLRIAEGNRLRHRKSLKKEFYDMEKVWSTADLMKETENALVHSDMRHRIYQLYCELRVKSSIFSTISHTCVLLRLLNRTKFQDFHRRRGIQLPQVCATGNPMKDIKWSARLRKNYCQISQ